QCDSVTGQLVPSCPVLYPFHHVNFRGKSCICIKDALPEEKSLIASGSIGWNFPEITADKSAEQKRAAPGGGGFPLVRDHRECFSSLISEANRICILYRYPGIRGQHLSDRCLFSLYLRLNHSM